MYLNRFTPSLTRRERGGVMTVVAALLLFGVLTGFVAISLDVGRALVEKRQLQNSADAAAQSLARSCWERDCGTASLATLVDDNAEDGVSGIASLCASAGMRTTNWPAAFRSVAGTAPVCGTASGALADCSPVPAKYASLNLPYVEVRTKTQSAVSGGGRTDSFRNWLGGLLGSPTSAAGACARGAIAAAPAQEPQLPITISGCEWQRATGGTIGGGLGLYVPAPDYSTGTYGYTTSGTPRWPTGAVAAPGYLPGGEIITLVQNPPGGQTPPSSCANWNGHALPGGFGLLETVGGNPCQARVYPYTWYHTNPGSSTSCDLSAFVGKVVNIPVYTCTLDYLPNRDANESTDPCDTGNGNNSYYWTPGSAKFYLSGFTATTASGVTNRVRSINPNNSIPGGRNPCSNSETCISGWFIEGSLTAPGIGGSPTGPGYFGNWNSTPLG